MPNSKHQDALALVTMLAIVAAIGGFLFGFDSGVINGTVDALAAAFHTASVGEGFSVGSLLLGCAVGAFFAGQWADRWGRRPVMLWTAVLFTVAAFGTGAAGSETAFIFFRLVGGIAVGAASVLSPAYIAEISPAAYRGRLGSLQQLAIVTGLFAAFASNAAIAHVAGSASAPWLFGAPAWRWMFWMEGLPSVAFLLGTLWIPESPRWLIGRGRHDEGAAIFARLKVPNVQAAVRDVEAGLQRDHEPRLSDLIDPKTKRLRSILWVGIGLSVFQQAVGINVVFYYGSVLWQSAGFSESNALMINVVTGLINILSTVVAILLIDKLGRRPLLLTGSGGMFGALLVQTLALTQGHLDPQEHVVLSTMAARIALLSANLYIIAFGISWGPVVWVMLGEMFHNQYRGAALALSAAIQWIANFVITMTFPILLAHVHAAGAYSVYTLGAFLSIFFVLRMVKETRGTTLEDVKE